MSFPIPPEGADWAIRWFTDPGWPVKPSPDLVTRLEAAVTKLEEMGGRGSGRVRIFQPEDVDVWARAMAPKGGAR